MLPLFEDHCFGNNSHVLHVTIVSLLCVSATLVCHQDGNPLWSEMFPMTFYRSFPLPSVSDTKSQQALFGTIVQITSFVGTGSHDVDQTFLEIMIFLSQPSEYLDNRQCHQAWLDCIIYSYSI